MQNYKLLIDGKLVDGDSRMDIINPATAEVLAVCPRGSVAQMDAAIAAAKAAFPGVGGPPDRRAPHDARKIGKSDRGPER